MNYDMMEEKWHEVCLCYCWWIKKKMKLSISSSSIWVDDNRMDSNKSIKMLCRRWFHHEVWLFVRRLMLSCHMNYTISTTYILLSFAHLLFISFHLLWNDTNGCDEIIQSAFRLFHICNSKLDGKKSTDNFPMRLHFFWCCIFVNILYGKFIGNSSLLLYNLLNECNPYDGQ